METWRSVYNYALREVIAHICKATIGAVGLENCHLLFLRLTPQVPLAIVFPALLRRL
jgi:hypothetical protein